MNRKVILYFQIHQPYRINQVGLTTPNSWQNWFVGETQGKYGMDMRNESIFNQVAAKSYLPVSRFWTEFLSKHPTFKLCLSFSGTFLEQCLDYPLGKEVLASFRQMVSTGQVEILSETYYHSLAIMVSDEEFRMQVDEHRRLVKKLFGVEPTTFRNTELIYSDHVGSLVEEMGYSSIFMENSGWNHFRQQKPQAEYFKPLHSTNDKPLILWPRDDLASDGLIFITGDPNRLKNSLLSNQKQITLIGTDFEFMGEHYNDHSSATFVLSKQLEDLLSLNFEFVTAREAVKLVRQAQNMLAEYSAPDFTSWGHTERDISVWRGNDLQEQAFKKLLQLYKLAENHPTILPAVRRLSTSCHFYFLGQKEGMDAEFVQLFSPFESTEKALQTFLKVVGEIESAYANLN